MLLIRRAIVKFIQIDMKDASCIYLLLYRCILIYPHYVKVTEHSLRKKETYQIKQFALINLELFHESKNITLSLSSASYEFKKHGNIPVSLYFPMHIKPIALQLTTYEIH